MAVKRRKKQKPRNKPTKLVKAVSGEKNASSTPTQHIPSSQESENMETHAPHLHHTTGKKKWHYFYEFIMLFLAVFCGFLAENWREHYVEHQREKQYAQQLIADLKADSLQFSMLYSVMSRVIDAQGTLINLVSTSPAPSDKEVITAIIPLQWAYRINKTSSTYDQMKSSGSLRYIRNKVLLNDIQRYYEIMLPFSVSMSDQYMRVYTEYFEPFSLDHFSKGDIDITSDTLINKNPIYRNRTEESDFKLRNITALYREYLTMSRDRFLVNDIQKINELTATLKQAYELQP